MFHCIISNTIPSICHFERSGVEKSGIRTISIIPSVTKVPPVRIVPINKMDFLITTLFLDLLFSGYAAGGIAKYLEINKRIDFVVACETLDKTILMMPNSL